MRLERLTTSQDQRYAGAMGLYQISFPWYEQRRPDSQTEIMGLEDYQFHLIYEDDTFVGILLCWETETFLYVEHFCVFPELRGRRYGQRALELLHQRGKRVILEIDPPTDEVSVHRKAFYERAGYQANAYEHIHPPYHETAQGHRLVVMSYPERLSQPEYDSFSRYLKDRVMGR